MTKTLKTDSLETILKALQKMYSQRSLEQKTYLDSLKGQDIYAVEIMEVITGKDFISKKYELEENKRWVNLHDALYKLLKIKTLKNKELNDIVERVYSNSLEEFGSIGRGKCVTGREEITKNQKIRWYS